MKYLEGLIRNYLYYNEESGYSVIKIEITDTNEPNLFFTEPTMIVCGFFPKLESMVKYRFQGELTMHPKYGVQYSATHFERLIDNTKEGIIDYLSSDLFPGIGPKTAERIVASLGVDAIDQIMNDYHVLDKIPHFPKKMRVTLYEKLRENRQMESTLVWLYGFQISPRMAMKIYQKYGTQAIDTLKQNPYLLMDEIEGIGFKRADEIGLKIGFSADSPLRIRAVVMYLFHEFVNKYGDTCLEKNRLFEFASQYLVQGDSFPIEGDVIIASVEAMVKEGKLIETDEFVSLRPLYYAEKKLGAILRRFASTPESLFEPAVIEQHLKEFAVSSSIHYTDSQLQAMRLALLNRLSVITGGPGTGKTTVINGIVALYRSMRQGALSDDLIKLVAPTGKAAKRLKDATGFEASTIHRVLGYDFSGIYQYDENNPLDCSLVIVDEASMMDVQLAMHLFQALPAECKIVIVGDEYQLPSVGPGQVLADLIASALCPIARLTKIHRQAANSAIITLAYEILSRQMRDELFSGKSDLEFHRVRDEFVAEHIVGLVRGAMLDGYDLYDDLQVLIPVYKGLNGIDNLNAMIQASVIDTTLSAKITFGDKVFYLGDKVLQLVNQPEDGVMNGDIGKVSGIIEGKQMLVDFSGIEVKYDVKDLDNLTLAYAVSIHKSQGSEFKLVILPLVYQYKHMLKRKLLYTAVTRAKTKLIIVGDYKVIRQGILGEEAARKTLLGRWLTTETVSEEPQVEVSPFDFL